LLCKFPVQNVLSQIEVVAFLDALQGERFATMFSFALITGCHSEEYLGYSGKMLIFKKNGYYSPRSNHSSQRKWLALLRAKNPAITTNNSFTLINRPATASAS
jgi:integrase